MDSYRQGDTQPPYMAVLRDGTVPYDASTALSVTVRAWRDGVELFARPGVADPSGLVTMNWVAGDLDEAGPIHSVIEVVRPSGRQSFPPNGFLKTIVHPATP
jgi:hypothetical protein